MKQPRQNTGNHPDPLADILRAQGDIAILRKVLEPFAKAASASSVVEGRRGDSYELTQNGSPLTFKHLIAAQNALDLTGPGLEPDWDQGHDPDADCLKAPR